MSRQVQQRKVGGHRRGRVNGHQRSLVVKGLRPGHTVGGPRDNRDVAAAAQGVQGSSGAARGCGLWGRGAQRAFAEWQRGARGALGPGAQVHGPLVHGPRGASGHRAARRRRGVRRALFDLCAKSIGTFQFIHWLASCGRLDRILLSLYRVYHNVRDFHVILSPGSSTINPSFLHLSTTLTSWQIYETDAYSKLAQSSTSLERERPVKTDLETELT